MTIENTMVNEETYLNEGVSEDTPPFVETLDLSKITKKEEDIFIDDTHISDEEIIVEELDKPTEELTQLIEESYSNTFNEEILEEPPLIEEDYQASLKEEEVTYKFPLTKEVYQLDEDGYFVTTTVADLSPVEADKGVYMIPYGCIDTPPPKDKPNVVYRWQNNKWNEVDNFIGTIIYNKETKEQGVITNLGPVPQGFTTHKPNSPYETWNDEKGWILTSKAKNLILENAKLEKLNEVNRLASDFINKETNSDLTPSFERETWTTQAEEVKAWKKDPNSPTPTLSLIASNRGIDLDLLRNKAYEKAIAYQLVSSIVIGQRQMYEDMIKKCESVEEVDRINIAYEYTTRVVQQ